jgi:hypothetical protein
MFDEEEPNKEQECIDIAGRLFDLFAAEYEQIIRKTNDESLYPTILFDSLASFVDEATGFISFVLSKRRHDENNHLQVVKKMFNILMMRRN